VAVTRYLTFEERTKGWIETRQIRRPRRPCPRTSWGVRRNTSSRWPSWWQMVGGRVVDRHCNWWLMA